MSSPILVAAIALPVAVVVAASVMLVWDRRLRAADTGPDVGLSIMERVDDRADTIGTWRPARRLHDAPAEDPTAWAESCGHIAELTTAVLCRIEARRGPGRHRRCYSGEWPVLVELGMPRAEVTV